MENFKRIALEVLTILGQSTAIAGSLMVITEMVGNIVTICKNPDCDGLKIIPVYNERSEKE